MEISCRHENWVGLAVEALRLEGYAVVTDVVDRAFLDETRAAMYRAQAGILREIGQARLERAGEMGVLRVMMRHEPHFFRFLAIPEVLAIVDRVVGETAVLHLQNGFILPSLPAGAQPSVFQNRFHQDFPRYLNGFVASLNVFFAIDAFTADNGATRFVPVSHQRAEAPSRPYLERGSVSAACPAGSMILFDSTLWHAAGFNTSGADRLAINHQFTRSWLKQQIDYSRALGEKAILGLPPRSQQLLGWFTRVPAGADEYYVPAEKRLYRANQG